MSEQCKARKIDQRAVGAGSTAAAAALFMFLVGNSWAASTPIEVLKEMPQTGTVRQGDVVYVDDGRCPAGEVKKIIGGNQKTGVARQVVCVKNPRTD